MLNQDKLTFSDWPLAASLPLGLEAHGGGSGLHWLLKRLIGAMEANASGRAGSPRIQVPESLLFCVILAQTNLGCVFYDRPRT